jgi:hypothetical protein
MPDTGHAAHRRLRLLSWIALGGAAMAGAQAVLLAVRGRILCLNDGCRVIEGLTTVPPLVFNVAGVLWFAATALVLRGAARRHHVPAELPRLLLLAGVGVEGVLLGYQAFVAHAFCAYCLVVCALVLLLNALAGVRQALAAAVVLGAALTAFAALRFGLPPQAPAPGAKGLDTGTFAVRRCSDPAKQLYLIFSSTCPHCREVMMALENCNSCNFHFNPIDRISTLDLEGIERTKSYDPEVNRTLLGLLGVDEVPVVLAQGPEGISVIRGQQRIVAYIREECFRTAPLLNVDPSRALAPDSMQIFRQPNDGCSVTVECGPDGKPKRP